MSPHVLVLGGTTEARRLAAELAARPGVRVTTSLAGRVSRPGALDGDVRVGGFGGRTGWCGGCASTGWTPWSTPPTPSPPPSRRTRRRAAAATGIPAVVLRRPAGPRPRRPLALGRSSPRPPRSSRPWAAVSSSPRAAWGLRPSPTSPSSTSSSVRWSPRTADAPGHGSAAHPGTLHTGRRADPAARTPGRRAGDQGQRRRGDGRQTDRRTRSRPPVVVVRRPRSRRT